MKSLMKDKETGGKYPEPEHRTVAWNKQQNLECFLQTYKQLLQCKYGQMIASQIENTKTQSRWAHHRAKYIK